MSYGVESSLSFPLENRVTIETAAAHSGISVDELKEYEREGFLIPLESRDGTSYYTELDYGWMKILRRLREEAQLSPDAIRELLLTRCGCWKFRHCEFHNTKQCPLTLDASKPCWVNRKAWSVLASYPCYSCLVYRTLPLCGALRAVLHGSPCLEAAGA